MRHDKASETSLLKIAIIGRGNVASHLIRAFAGKADCVMVNPHTLHDLPTDAQLYLIAVADNAVEKVCNAISRPHAIIAHTSGSIVIEGVDVFYPLQTFSKDSSIDYSQIPILIEASSGSHLQLLKKAASLFSQNILVSSPELRRLLHLAAVFACNFSNKMLTIADDILASRHIPLSILRPLVQQTIQKAFLISPRQAQTGPAARHDCPVIEQERELLASLAPQHIEIYDSITKSILNND